ncbi:hypothetical protein GYMLUDRAFT_253220 [Collybiopsis luxurians FD-317 M1]|uniref:F-box domain-containing protein n=1 Tax=Collybiopsis luxurians FD-317 M1 TaxID=944289 RepID=A0A0D0C621_9AGAR|nr:hypothetical protein GYMLUDRAFT_253220 [Collybiopsis luxurians FD-317 M1]
MPSGKDCKNSPSIDRLPVELLLEVFSLSNTFNPIEDEDFSEESPTQINRNAVALSHVNSRWRLVSLSTPSLWSTFDISLSSTSWDKVPVSLPMLIAVHLERSKNAVLDIRVAFDRNNVNYARSFPILPRLFKEAHRWRSSVLVLPESQELISTIFPTTFPLLHELHMRLLPLDDVGSCRAPVFHAAALRTLSISMFGYGGDYNLNCLCDVTLTWVSPNIAARFLDNVPSHCSAKIVTLVASPHSSYDACEVTSALSALSITATENNLANDEHALANLLRSLTLPNVERLEFIDEGHGFYFPVEPFISMLGRSQSFCTDILHLKLDNYSISDVDLLKILRHLHALTFLTLKEARNVDAGRPLTEQFFYSLDHSNSANSALDDRYKCVIPKLTCIELQLESRPHPWHALNVFLTSRLPPVNDAALSHVAPLRSAHISVEHWAWADVADFWTDEFCKHRLQGLDITSTSSSILDSQTFFALRSVKHRLNLLDVLDCYVTDDVDLGTHYSADGLFTTAAPFSEQGDLRRTIWLLVIPRSSAPDVSRAVH